MGRSNKRNTNWRGSSKTIPICYDMILFLNYPNMLEILHTKLQTVEQRCSNENSMVLAQKQKGTPMEQNKRPRYESMQLHPLDF
jgi:hypothetical protein